MPMLASARAVARSFRPHCRRRPLPSL